MLDAQRYRQGSIYAELRLLRGVLFMHFLLGLMAAVLLALHGLLPWAGAAVGWFVISLGLIAAMTSRGWVRIPLGLWFAVFSAGGVFLLAQVVPKLQPATPPLLPLGFLSIWLGLANFAYGVGAAFLLFSTRIRRATASGFSLRSNRVTS